MRAHRTLRSRLFSWFVGAIVLAIVTGSTVGITTRPEPLSGADAMAENVALHLAAIWEDYPAARAFTAEIGDVTGFDVRLLRDPRYLNPRIRRIAGRGGAFVNDGVAHVFIPVVRDGVLLGAVEMGRFGSRAAPWAWWRFALVLAVVMAVLSLMANAVADQLARPLERLALAADRFGGGDLTVRTDVAGGGRRWVAREVRDVAVRFNRMAERVEATVRGQRELLIAISHELRSPLGRARIALEIARDRCASDSPSSPAETALDDVEKQLGAINTILGDLLDVTRTGLSDLRTETRVFAEWLRQRVAEEPPVPVIELYIASQLESLALAFDPALLARAVHNLFLNARTHGHPATAPITVRVEETPEGAVPMPSSGRWLRVVVRDRGPGLPAHFSEKAFEPFVRGDAARSRPREGAGYGFGLAIVRRIVEAHGGRAFASNVENASEPQRVGVLGEEPGAGAAIGFDLPFAGGSR